ncbi:hypothetical protein D3C87_1564220 [compost metagenome]
MNIVVQAYLKNVDPNSKLPNITSYSKYIEMKIDNKKKPPLATDDYTIRIYPIFAYSVLRSGTHVSGNPYDFSIGSDSASLALVKKEVKKAGFAEQWDLIKASVGFSYLKTSYPITPKYFIPKDAPVPDTDNTFIVVTYIQDSGDLTWSKKIPVTVQK